MGPGAFMGGNRSLGASDLFVLLEKEYRRRARGCATCAFTLPYRIRRNEAGEGAWSVIPTASCSPDCRSVLEDLVALFQKSYRLA